MNSPRLTTRSLMTLVALVGLSMGAKFWADARLAHYSRIVRQYLEPKLGRVPDSLVSPN